MTQRLVIILNYFTKQSHRNCVFIVLIIIVLRILIRTTQTSKGMSLENILGTSLGHKTCEDVL